MAVGTRERTREKERSRSRTRSRKQRDEKQEARQPLSVSMAFKVDVRAEYGQSIPELVDRLRQSVRDCLGRAAEIESTQIDVEVLDVSARDGR